MRKKENLTFYKNIVKYSILFKESVIQYHYP